MAFWKAQVRGKPSYQDDVRYILDKDDNVMVAPSEAEYRMWRRNKNNWMVGTTEFMIPSRPELKAVLVSTVCLQEPAGFQDNNSPIMFESCVFGGALDGTRRLYRTWREAARGHRALADAVEAILNGGTEWQLPLI